MCGCHLCEGVDTQYDMHVMIIHVHVESGIFREREREQLPMTTHLESLLPQ